MAAGLQELQISVSDLELGMHVVRLDRPWIETDFLMQGFIIQDQGDIDALRRQCEFVFIEGRVIEDAPPPRNPPPTERRRQPQGLFARKTPARPKPAPGPAQSAKSGQQTMPEPGRRVQYINKISMQRELPSANNTYHSAKETVHNIMNGIRMGRMLDMNQARETVDTVVDSVLRNKDALAWLTKIKDKDDYTAEHSLNVCILSATFARHLGHDDADIRKIALCGLLHDVGKSKVPDSILNKEGRFTDEEFEAMKLHTVYGRDLLMNLSDADRIAIDVAHSHHERIDGLGYPRQLKEHQIPYFAKIVSLTDCYDAITSTRCYDKGRASMEALDIIYRCKGAQFDEELALAFIKCIGIYPPGSIVTLNSGEVAIILATNPEYKLKPKVLVVLDADKNPCQERVMDMSQGVTDSSGRVYAIAHEIPDGSHGIFLKTYLEKGLVLKGAAEQ